MINPVIIRKYAAYLIMSMLNTIGFFVGFTYYGIWVGVGVLFVTIVISIFIGNMLLANPFTKMLEGKGIIALNLDSTGIISPFIIGVDSPYIKGKLLNKEITDVFDRNTVFNLAIPRENSKGITVITEELVNDAYTMFEGRRALYYQQKLKKIKNDRARKAKQTKYDKKFKEECLEAKKRLNSFIGSMQVTLNEQDYNAGRFAMLQYPAIIFNNQMNSVLTKDFLSNKEKETFAEHNILFLNRKMEELTSVVRDFGRYVVETLRPKTNFFASKWGLAILIIALIILAIMFGPSILNAVAAASKGTGTAIGGAVSGTQIITK